MLDADGAGLCPSNEAWERIHAEAVALRGSQTADFRVTPAFGTRNESVVRITVIDNLPTNHSAESLNFFDYSAEFEYAFVLLMRHTHAIRHTFLKVGMGQQVRAHDAEGSDTRRADDVQGRRQRLLY